MSRQAGIFLCPLYLASYRGNRKTETMQTMQSRQTFPPTTKDQFLFQAPMQKRNFETLRFFKLFDYSLRLLSTIQWITEKVSKYGSQAKCRDTIKLTFDGIVVKCTTQNEDALWDFKNENGIWRILKTEMMFSETITNKST